ncbi:52 kDa repressor of the inhibitor of the protein kinase-like [Diabrotica virgifera virgifera]|uniref:HAT C-terminal dimerisation domain-containing protein n=1 Tax=Diabrotica virgifera virgifera TaxID=50390 RepID=A0ABM5KFH8_DIAVI|nr:52 kDa repressor of the inhibitor of the protein kinase-like [Diabrotica virgifera virgifera]
MDRFLVKKRRISYQEEQDVEEQSGLSPSHNLMPVDEPAEDQQSTSTSVDNVNSSSHDIGYYLQNISSSNDHSKYIILTQHWTPEKTYQFPTSSHIKRGREELRRVNHGHFEKYPWLVFSEFKQGLFCKYCAVFCHGKKAGGQNTVPLRKLVSEPLNKYAKLSGKDGDLESHNSNEYHKKAELDSKNYIKIFENPDLKILSLSLRYVYQDVIREDFVGFIDLHKANYSHVDVDPEVEPVITGEILGQTVVNFMIFLGLKTNNCVGISCDGCSVNMSEMRGAVTEIQKVATNSIMCGCKNHALNLSISKCNKVQHVRNALGTIKEVTSFFNSSGKRNSVLKKVLGHQMRGYCETRWVERHEAVLEFTEDMPKIAEALKCISQWRDSTTSSKARALLCSISTCDFIITMHCLSDTADVTCGLSKYLQTEAIDVCSAKSKIDNMMKTIQNKRDKTNEFFLLIFSSAEKTMDAMDVQMRVPRIVRKQVNRPNYTLLTGDNQRSQVSKYWETAVYIPILDNLITDLTSRFSDESLDCYKLNILVPSTLDSVSNVKSSFESICDKYSSVLSIKKETMLMKILNEICSLKNMVNYNVFKEISTPMTCFQNLDEHNYPILKSLVQILLTLPISIATAERSFSTLRRLKSWMRTRMTEDRLTGLALMNVHRDIEVDIGHQ